MIRVHVLEGRATIDTLGTEPDPQCRVWVAGIGLGDLNIENVGIDEPIAISGFVGPTETPISAENFDGRTYLDVNQVLPNVPKIIDVAINAANTEASLALPLNTRRFEILLQEEDADLELAFEPGGSTWPIPCGVSYLTSQVNAGTTMLYFKTNKAPRTVKVLTWSIA
jgi:hypothetical protein